MKTNIENLVEEALKKLAGSNLGETYTTNVLTTLAEKASQNGLQPLPEEMPEWFNTFSGAYLKYNELRQHFGTKPLEWWMGLEKGDKFVQFIHGEPITRTFYGEILLKTTEHGINCNIIDCSPYTEPTALEQFMASLTLKQLELAKRLKIEEGGGLEK